MKKLLFISLCVISFSCSTKNGKWKKFTSANYTIDYPANWELNENATTGASFFLFSPLESGQDLFKENVNLLIQDLTGQSIDLNKYTEITENQVKTMLSNSTLIESKRMKNGSQEYQRMIYKGDESGKHLEFEQYFWVIGTKAYVLTLTCEQTQFEAYKATGEKILNSFQFTK
jgi:hypothetical protein